MKPKNGLPLLDEPRPWAVREDRIPTLVARLARLRAGEGLVPLAAQGDPAPTPGGVAVLRVWGDIMPKDDGYIKFFGGVALDAFRARLSAAVADPAIKAIVLDIDSGGGEVTGLQETAALMRSLREQKPIVAVANPVAASAAYYLAAQAGEVVINPDGMAGWVGTVMIHMEVAQALAEMGVGVNIIRNPPRKYEGSMLEPLSPEARDRFQAVVDQFTGQFVADVAKGRGVLVSKVKADFGGGTGLMAQEAKAAGMVDRIDTLENVVARLLGQKAGGKAARAEDPAPAPVAELPPAAALDDADRRRQLRRLVLEG